MWEKNEFIHNKEKRIMMLIDTLLFTSTRDISIIVPKRINMHELLDVH